MMGKLLQERLKLQMRAFIHKCHHDSPLDRFAGAAVSDVSDVFMTPPRGTTAAVEVECVSASPVKVVSSPKEMLPVSIAANMKDDDRIQLLLLPRCDVITVDNYFPSRTRNPLKIHCFKVV